MDTSDAQVSLEKQLRSATSPWDRLPILIALSKELSATDPERLHHYASEAFVLAKELKDPFWTGCSLLMMSMRLTRTAQFSESVQLLKQASDLFQQIKDFRMKTEADFTIARIYILANKLDEAMKVLLDLRYSYQGMQTPRGSINLLYCIGDVYRLAGDWSTGLKYYRRAIRIMKETGERNNASILYHRLAASYRVMEDSERYRKYMLLSLSLCRKSRDKAGTAIALANIGNAYMDQERYREAEKYVRQSIKLYRELGYRSYEAMGWARLGSIYEHLNEFPRAFCYFRRGLALARECEDHLILGLVYENFGGLCIKMGLTKRGFAYLHKGLDLVGQSGQLNHRQKAYEALATAYEHTGQAQKALEHYKQAARIKQEYINSTKIAEASHAEMKARFQPLARKLKKAQSQNDTLRKIIAQKEAELLSLTLAMVQNEEENSNAKRRGPTRRTATPPKNRSNGLSENWETFARQFHKVHHDFYANLVQQYPILTATEVKVCSLIRIGLSSKEIAGILCVSRRTVDSHRVRIHKKMELPSGASLAGFIACL